MKESFQYPLCEKKHPATGKEATTQLVSILSTAVRNAVGSGPAVSTSLLTEGINKAEVSAKEEANPEMVPP